MSGHNKWSGIKHRKAAVDSKRAKSFTKHGKLIAIAARDGGGNPESNFQLRLAIDRARLDNMPKDNIDRAIKRGTGELKDGSVIEEIVYEGVGPGNVMMIIKATTDNRNRAFNEIRTILTKGGGKLGEMGSAMWNFKKVGAIKIDLAQNGNKDELEEKAIEAGADDIDSSDDFLVVYTAPENMKSVQTNLENLDIKASDAVFDYLATQKVELSETDTEAYEKLFDTLDAHDDVEEVFDNLA